MAKVVEEAKEGVEVKDVLIKSKKPGHKEAYYW